MVASIDHYWLLTAIRFGLPATVFIGIATLLGLLLIMRASTAVEGRDGKCLRGMAIAMGVFALGLISVSIWLSAQVWYFLLLGLIVSLAKDSLMRSEHSRYGNTRPLAAGPPKAFRNHPLTTR